MIINMANYVKYIYFCNYDGIDNVTLQLWKLSAFSSRHTVGIVEDPIMSVHIWRIYWVCFSFWQYTDLQHVKINVCCGCLLFLFDFSNTQEQFLTCGTKRRKDAQFQRAKTFYRLSSVEDGNLIWRMLIISRPNHYSNMGSWNIFGVGEYVHKWDSIYPVLMMYWQQYHYITICPFVRLQHFQVAVHLLTNHLEQMLSS